MKKVGKKSPETTRKITTQKDQTASKPIRILQIGLHDQIGGIETFLMNYYNDIDTTKIQFDFVSHHSQMAYEQEIKEKGGIIHHIPAPKKHPIKYFKTIQKIIKEHNYQVVHIHMRSAANILPILAAKKSHIKCIITHSHSTNTPKNPIKKILHYLNRPIVKKSDIHYACSQAAGKWMFGNEPFEVMYNAIDINKFKYNESKRNSFRKTYKIPKKAFVIGHIGRFSKEKNQKYILRIFKQTLEEKPNALLVLAGSGKSQKQIKNYAKKLKISDKVIFTGLIRNTDDFYSAIDVFLLPSLYEGLPVCSVEAQISNAKCIISDHVTTEINIQTETKNLPINKKSIPLWVKAICEKRKTSRKNLTVSEQVEKYNIKNASAALQKQYQQLHNVPKKTMDQYSYLFAIGYILTIAAEMLYSLPFMRNYLPILNVIGLALISIYTINALRKTKNKKEAKAFLVLLGLAAITFLCSRDTIPLKLCLLFFAIRQYNFSQTIKLDYKTKLFFTTAIILLSIVNLSSTRVFYRLNGSPRFTFGFTHPNTFGIYSSLLIIERIYIYYKDKNQKKINIAASIIILLLNLFVTQSRASVVLLFIATITYIIPYEKLAKFMNKVQIRLLLQYSMLICFMVSISFITIAYSDNEIARIINNILSYRPAFAGAFYKNTPLNLFGWPMKDTIANIPLDNSYLLILLKYGLIQLLIYLSLSTKTFKTLHHKKEYLSETVLALMFIYGIMENATIKPGIDVFILSLSYGVSTYVDQKND